VDRNAPDAKLKAACLAKYQNRKPTHFLQLDGFFHPDGAGDGIMPPDLEGDCLTGGAVVELMNGAEVRLLVRNGTAPAVAARLARKLAAWLEKDGERFIEKYLTDHQCSHCHGSGQVIGGGHVEDERFHF
jgi:hypothetical protein